MKKRWDKKLTECRDVPWLKAHMTLTVGQQNSANNVYEIEVRHSLCLFTVLFLPNGGCSVMFHQHMDVWGLICVLATVWARLPGTCMQAWAGLSSACAGQWLLQMLGWAGVSKESARDRSPLVAWHLHFCQVQHTHTEKCWWRLVLKCF